MNIRRCFMMTFDSLEFINNWCQFNKSTDVYVLLAVARKKFNPLTNSQEVVFREVIKNKDEIVKKYNKINILANHYRSPEGKKFNFYMYLTVNSRDSIKGLFGVKDLLNSYIQQHINGTDVSNRLKKIDEVWVSSLMKPMSRSSRYFMIDFDSKDKDALRKVQLELIGSDVGYIKTIETRDGYHILTKPFNRKKLEQSEYKPLFEIKTDALVYIESIGDFE